MSELGYRPCVGVMLVNGDGKVFVTLLGHDGKSQESSEFQKIVLNGVDWATS